LDGLLIPTRRSANKEINMKVTVALIITATVSFVFAATESPYSGQQTRELKALSQEEIQGYLSGRGMGYAKAAELNHYPGPKHVMELAGQLGLTPPQIKQTQAIFVSMQNQAAALGKQLVEKEMELDKQFAAGQINNESLNSLLSN